MARSAVAVVRSRLYNVVVQLNKDVSDDAVSTDVACSLLMPSAIGEEGCLTLDGILPSVPFV